MNTCSASVRALRLLTWHGVTSPTLMFSSSAPMTHEVVVPPDQFRLMEVSA